MLRNVLYDNSEQGKGRSVRKKLARRDGWKVLECGCVGGNIMVTQKEGGKRRQMKQAKQVSKIRYKTQGKYMQ